MRLYIICGEESGDLYASDLISEIKKHSNVDIRGFGGDNMRNQGVTIAKHINEISFMGFTEVIFNLRSIIKNINFCKKDILEYRPDAIILIDYPGFNLKIARFASKNGIKVFYYIPPKLWASRKGRINIIRKYVDELIVIFPFEVDFFRTSNWACAQEKSP